MRTKKSSWGQRILFSGLFVFCVLSLPDLPAHAIEKWQKTFGGVGYDLGNSVQQATDGGYIIAGTTTSYGAGSGDVYLIKTNAKGKKLWEKTFGGPKSDYGSSVQQTRDGGYIIVGYTESYGEGSSDVYLIKTNSKGNKLWEKTFGGMDDDYGNSVQQTTDGGYIIVGWTKSYGAGDRDVYLIKTDSKGTKLWQKTFGGSSADEGSSVQQTKDGGFIIVGKTESHGVGSNDVYLIKTDGTGKMIWERAFGGIDNDYGSSVQQTKDGGYVIVGCIESYGSGSSDVYLIRTNSKGDTLWEQTFGGTDNDWGNSVQQTTDGGFIIAGHTVSYGAGRHTANDVYLIKTDAKGNKLWEKTFGGIAYDWGNSVHQTKDGGYVIAGTTRSYGTGEADVYLVKTDANGKLAYRLLQ